MGGDNSDLVWSDIFSFLIACMLRELAEESPKLDSISYLGKFQGSLMTPHGDRKSQGKKRNIQAKITHSKCHLKSVNHINIPATPITIPKARSWRLDILTGEASFPSASASPVCVATELQ